MLELQDLAELVARFREHLDASPPPFTLRGHTFHHHPKQDLMGVVNLSPIPGTGKASAFPRKRRFAADDASSRMAPP